MRNRRSEIATILMIGTVVVMGITAVLSSLTINKKQSTSSRASGGTCTTFNCKDYKASNGYNYPQKIASVNTDGYWSLAGCTGTKSSTRAGVCGTGATPTIAAPTVKPPTPKPTSIVNNLLNNLLNVSPTVAMGPLPAPTTGLPASCQKQCSKGTPYQLVGSSPVDFCKNTLHGTYVPNSSQTICGKAWLCCDGASVAPTGAPTSSGATPAISVSPSTPDGIDPTLYPQNGARTADMACCFKKADGTIRVYASAAAREANQMDTPCTIASYGSAYGAVAWFECPDGTQDHSTAEEYEATIRATIPTEAPEEIPEEQTPTCLPVKTFDVCKSIDGQDPDNTYVYSSGTCCPTTDPSAVDPSTAPVDPNASCDRHLCTSLSPSFSSVKTYRQKSTQYFSDSACTTPYADLNAVYVYCSETVTTPVDNVCREALNDPTAQCALVLDPGAGYEKTNSTCGPLNKFWCWRKAPGMDYISRRCDSIDPNYSHNYIVYEKNGEYYSKSGTTYTKYTTNELAVYCSQGLISPFDNTCKNDLGDATAQCALVFSPGDGYVKTGQRCGPFNSKFCWQKKPAEPQGQQNNQDNQDNLRIDTDTTTECVNTITDNGVTYCVTGAGVLVPLTPSLPSI